MRRRPPTGGAGPEHAATWPQIVGDFTAATRAEPGCLWFGPMFGVSGWSVAIVAVGLVLLVATSLTDALTGIPNRRRLKADLEQGLKDASPANPLLLLFDLNGFKAYNDTFGHPAGDALLVRLATALDRAMQGLDGRACRLGGDELCVLACAPGDRARAVTAAAAQALTEYGGGVLHHRLLWSTPSPSWSSTCAGRPGRPAPIPTRPPPSGTTPDPGGFARFGSRGQEPRLGGSHGG